MTTRTRWFALIAVLAVGLSISHYLCFRKGQTEQLAELIPAIKRQKKEEAHIHLTFLIRTLRLAVRHPDAIPAADTAELCRQAKDYAQTIEQQSIPELREAGNEERAKRHEALIRETRTLIGRTRR